MCASRKHSGFSAAHTHEFALARTASGLYRWQLKEATSSNSSNTTSTSDAFDVTYYNHKSEIGASTNVSIPETPSPSNVEADEYRALINKRFRAGVNPSTKPQRRRQASGGLFAKVSDAGVEPMAAETAAAQHGFAPTSPGPAVRAATVTTDGDDVDDEGVDDSEDVGDEEDDDDDDDDVQRDLREFEQQFDRNHNSRTGPAPHSAASSLGIDRLFSHGQVQPADSLAPRSEPVRTNRDRTKSASKAAAGRRGQTPRSGAPEDVMSTFADEGESEGDEHTRNLRLQQRDMRVTGLLFATRQWVARKKAGVVESIINAASLFPSGSLMHVLIFHEAFVRPHWHPLGVKYAADFFADIRNSWDAVGQPYLTAGAAV